MNLKLSNQSETVEVSSQVFEAPYNEALIHQVVNAMLANSKTGTRKQKTRSEVRGGGIKPWRQKGTGRARAGSIRSPLWKGGGTMFAADPNQQNREVKVNKKMVKGCLRSMLSELIRQGYLQLVDNIELEQPKTKQLLNLLKQYDVDQALLVTAETDSHLVLASRNIPTVEAVTADEVTPLNLLKYKNTVMTTEALRQIEDRLL